MGAGWGEGRGDREVNTRFVVYLAFINRKSYLAKSVRSSTHYGVYPACLRGRSYLTES